MYGKYWYLVGRFWPVFSHSFKTYLFGETNYIIDVVSFNIGGSILHEKERSMSVQKWRVLLWTKTIPDPLV